MGRKIVKYDQSLLYACNYQAGFAIQTQKLKLPREVSGNLMNVTITEYSSSLQLIYLRTKTGAGTRRTHPNVLFIFIHVVLTYVKFCDCHSDNENGTLGTYK